MRLAHTRFHPVPLALAIALSLAAPGGALAQAASGGAQPVTISIAAQPLGSALNELSAATGTPIGFSPALVAGKTARAIKGDLTARQAVDQLLAGSGLVAVQEAGGFVIKAAEPTGEVATLDAVTVTGQAGRAYDLPEAYAGGQVARGGRLGMLGNTDVMDAPFNITSYTADLIESQQARTLDAVLVNDPSVRQENGSDSAGVNYRIRGFEVFGYDATLNGLAGMTSDARGLLQGVERVEVLKGPSAALNGMGTGGGVGGSVNLVTKRAADEPLTRFTASYLSDSRVGGHLDVGRRFGEAGEWGVRSNLYWLKGDTALTEQSERIGLATLGLDYRGRDTRLSLDVIHQNQRIEGSGRYVMFADKVLAAPDFDHNIFAGEIFKKKSTTIMLAGEHDFGNGVEGFFGLGHSRETTDAPSMVAARVSDNSGNFMAREIYSYQELDKTSGQAGLRAGFQTGAMAHRVTLGLSRYSDEKGLAYTYGSPSASNIYAPVRPDIPARPDSRPRASETMLDGITLADTVSFLDDRLLLTAGLRHQRIDVKNYDTVTGALSSRYKTSANSPLLGIVFKQSEQLSWYANLAQGLSKGDTAPSNASNPGEMLPPYKTKQMEAGVKLDLGSFGSSLSLFQIKKPSATLNTTTNIYAENGTQRNRGIEWSVFGEPMRNVRVLGGLVLMRSKMVESPDVSVLGKDGIGVPKVQLNLGGEWDVSAMPGLSLNARVIYTSKQYLNATNTQQLPSWTRWDVGARYKTVLAGKHTVFRLDVENLFNKNYWVGVYGTATSLSSPRTVMLSATVDF